MTSAILFVGMVVLLMMGLLTRHHADGTTYTKIPDFYPWGALGGAMWATGNVLTVVAIKLIGLSVGLCIWSSSNMLMGWSTGTFGLFGTPVNTVAVPWLNYVGVGLACCALVMYIFVKVEDGSAAVVAADVEAARDGAEQALANVSGSHGSSPAENEIALLRPSGANGGGALARAQKKAAVLHAIRAKTLAFLDGSAGDSPRFTEAEATPTLFAHDLATEVKYDVLPGEIPSPFDVLERQNAAVRKVCGVVLAIGMGLLYGSTFTPVAFDINNHAGVSDNYLDFVFSHYCGIFFTSTCWWLLYCVAMCNRPRIYPKLILPAFASGVMWGIAQTAWFVANGALGFSVAFPMITSGPGILASFWGVVLFKEIKGARNFAFLGGALVFTVASGLCIGISKDGV
jgi:glucose uptake protein GlcU